MPILIVFNLRINVHTSRNASQSEGLPPPSQPEELRYAMQLIEDLPADGPANMKRDLHLLESLSETAILRIYSWLGPWASYGYFQKEEEVRTHFKDETISLVKRPTGGGIVDHRNDFTYTLLLPRNHPLTRLSREDCYHRIHELIQESLAIPTTLSRKPTDSGAACFLSPVPGDLIDHSGQKIAGAAQRRTRHGILHQGSILATVDIERLAKKFRAQLAP